MNSSITFKPDEVAKIAGVTRRTVYAWIKDGKLPAHKMGPKLWVVHQRVLVAFMEGEQPDMLRAIAAALNTRLTVMPVLGQTARVEAIQAAKDQENAKKQREQEQREQREREHQELVARLRQSQPVQAQAQQPPKPSIWGTSAQQKAAQPAQAQPAKTMQPMQNRPSKNKKARR